MKKKELLGLKVLKATSKMMRMAERDQPVRKAEDYWGGKHFYVTYQHGLYMRCAVVGGLLKVAFFLTEHMRAGGRMPAYELYVDREAGEFLTYDRTTDKWLTAKLDMVPWPDSVCFSEKKWISEQGNRLVKEYLGVEHGGYKGLLEYQLKVRADELKRRHKRETDPWDLDLEQTPGLPKDWVRWVEKVGIMENYIFYRYDRKGVKTGYCTFCEKEVEVRKPRHNKAGCCLRCRHAVTFKALGKAGTVMTSRNYMYLSSRDTANIGKGTTRIRNATAGNAAGPSTAIPQNRSMPITGGTTSMPSSDGSRRTSAIRTGMGTAGGRYTGRPFRR